MVSIWNREYMATHSIGGQKSPTDPDKTTPPKPKIDEDAFQAIRSMCLVYFIIPSLPLTSIYFSLQCLPLNFGVINIKLPWTRHGFVQQSRTS